MKKIDVHPIGRRVAGKRVEKGLTQKQLADKASLTQRSIAMIEGGARRGLSVGALAEIANVLEVSLDYLVFGSTRA